jgi:hypothetical protein
MPESSERKPSPGDPFTEDPKTEWAEFVLGASPKNRTQKKVDFSQPNQLWHFLGKTSTESKAQYTADPSKPIHDPLSNFLHTVEPSKPIMAPPSQPKRQSLAASYPSMTANMNMAARNAAMVSQRQQMLDRQFPHIQRLPYSMPSGGHPWARPQPSLDQRQILERQHQKAQQLDMQEKPYGTPQPPRSPLGIGIDMQAVERQRQFQLQATKQSRSYTDWQGRVSLPAPQNYQSLLPMQNRMPPNTPSPTHYSPYAQYPSPSQSQSPMQNHRQPQITAGPTQPAPEARQESQLSVNQSIPTQTGHGRPYPQLGQSPSPVQRMDPVGAYEDRIRIQNERARVEQVRAAANQNSADGLQHDDRRISASASFPFKPPEELKAQKDERDAHQSPPSRPDSDYMQHHSPTIKQEQHSTYQYQNLQQQRPPVPHQSDGHYPPSFINPNATQISPPSTSSMYSAPALMGPPAAPFRRPSLSTNPPPSQSHNEYDSNENVKLQQRSLVQRPSDKLLAALTPLPMLPSGRPENDVLVPEDYRKWSDAGGFWGRVADYFIESHRSSPTVYTSPYVDKYCVEEDKKARKGLASEFYDRLGDEDKAKIDTQKREMANSPMLNRDDGVNVGLYE